MRTAFDASHTTCDNEATLHISYLTTHQEETMPKQFELPGQLADIINHCALQAYLDALTTIQEAEGVLAEANQHHTLFLLSIARFNATDSPLGRAFMLGNFSRSPFVRNLIIEGCSYCEFFTITAHEIIRNRLHRQLACAGANHAYSIRIFDKSVPCLELMQRKTLSYPVPMGTIPHLHPLPKIDCWIPICTIPIAEVISLTLHELTQENMCYDLVAHLANETH